MDSSLPDVIGVPKVMRLGMTEEMDPSAMPQDDKR